MAVLRLYSFYRRSGMTRIRAIRRALASVQRNASFRRTPK